MTALKAVEHGVPSRTRTCDRLLRRQMLYPTELWAQIAMVSQSPGVVPSGEDPICRVGMVKKLRCSGAKMQGLPGERGEPLC